MFQISLQMFSLDNKETNTLGQLKQLCEVRRQ